MREWPPSWYGSPPDAVEPTEDDIEHPYGCPEEGCQCQD